jgi:hypothetical protein
LTRPTDEQILTALEYAQSYKPSVKKELQGKETPPPRYYGLSIELDLHSGSCLLVRDCLFVHDGDMWPSDDTSMRHEMRKEFLGSASDIGV